MRLLQVRIFLIFFEGLQQESSAKTAAERYLQLTLFEGDKLKRISE